MSIFSSIYLMFIRMSKLLSRKGLYPFLHTEFNKIKSGQRVLIIGAGGKINNILNEYSINNNFNIISFDISSKRNPDILGDICTYDFNCEKFDVVVIAEVLEHLHSPHLAINNIKNILSDNGRLILTVPFIFPIHDRPYDYYRYTKYGLKFLLRDFNNVIIDERNTWIDAISVLFVRLIMNKDMMSKLFAILMIIIVFLNLPYIYILSKLIKTDFITTGYVVTAVKKSIN